MTATSYDTLLQSDSWRQQLSSLNHALIQALDEFDAPQQINGNLFYDHLQSDFHEHDLLPDCNEKRRRFFRLAQQANCLFEIGVNGGHSMFLALSANPHLRCIGVDICRQLQPSWGRVDVYVPAAIEWLRQHFNSPIEFFPGDSRVVVPTYVADQLNRPQSISIDMLHLDGDKKTYLTDFINIYPLLADDAVIVVDDTNMRMCRRVVEQLIAIGYAEKHPDFPEINGEKYANTVLRKV